MAHEGFILGFAPVEGAKPALSLAYDALGARGLFPEGGTFWFAWCETDIRLPRPFSPELFLPHWEEVRLFSKQAELRGVRGAAGEEVRLLTEDNSLEKELIAEAGGFVPLASHFKVEPGRRLLVGKAGKITRVANGRAARRSETVVAAFPLPLDYGTELGERQVWEAEVRYYTDSMGRLRLVRYCTLQALSRPEKMEQIGDRPVRPFDETDVP